MGPVNKEEIVEKTDVSEGMNEDVRVVTVDAENVAAEGFFCYKSKPKSEGYRRKMDWLEKRFAEGMQIKILYEGKRSVAFIEYIPGEFAWRAVDAKGYFVIHCLWVVGKGKKKGYGSRLLAECVQEARARQKHGVAMVTSGGNWLAGSKLFLRNGFESVDQAPPSFELLVKKLGDAPDPAFPTDWEERLARYGTGLTVLRSDQCPYIDNGVKIVLETAIELGIPAQVIEVADCRQAQDLSPSPYGLFGVLYEGKLLSYHYIGRKELLQRLEAFAT
jgi:L-amino acid N-acyltransferase YncA